MNISHREQKRVKLKQFLKILSEDPSLLNQDGLNELRSLSEILIISGYQPWHEPVDMASVLSLLLRKLGVSAGSADMMEYMMNGGSVEDFMNTETQVVHRRN